MTRFIASENRGCQFEIFRLCCGCTPRPWIHFQFPMFLPVRDARYFNLLECDSYGAKEVYLLSGVQYLNRRSNVHLMFGPVVTLYFRRYNFLLKSSWCCSICSTLSHWNDVCKKYWWHGNFFRKKTPAEHFLMYFKSLTQIYFGLRFYPKYFPYNFNIKGYHCVFDFKSKYFLFVCTNSSYLDWGSWKRTCSIPSSMMCNIQSTAMFCAETVAGTCRPIWTCFEKTSTAFRNRAISSRTIDVILYP